MVESQEQGESKRIGAFELENAVDMSLFLFIEGFVLFLLLLGRNQRIGRVLGFSEPRREPMLGLMYLEIGLQESLEHFLFGVIHAACTITSVDVLFVGRYEYTLYFLENALGEAFPGQTSHPLIFCHGGRGSLGSPPEVLVDEHPEGEL